MLQNGCILYGFMYILPEFSKEVGIRTVLLVAGVSGGMLLISGFSLIDVKLGSALMPTTTARFMQTNKASILKSAAGAAIVVAVFMSGYYLVGSPIISVGLLAAAVSIVVLLLFASRLDVSCGREVAFCGLSRSDEISSEGVYRASPDGSIIAVNDSLVAMLGFSSKEDLINIWGNRSDFAADYDEYRNFMSGLFSEARIRDSRQTFKTASGSTVPVRESAMLVKDVSSGASGWLGRVADLSIVENSSFELNSARILTRAFIDNSDDLIAAVSPDKICMMANSAFADFAGLGTAQLCEGRSFSDCLPPRTATDFLKAVDEVLDAGAELDSFEMIMPDCRSRDRIFLIRMSPLMDASEKVCGVVFSARDITGKVEAENSARESADSAREALRQRSEVIRNMSHELRTPLSGIIGAFEVLKASCLEPGQGQCAEGGLIAAKRLNEVLGEILGLAGEGYFDVTVGKVEPVKLVRSVFEAFSPLAGEKGVELSLENEGTPNFIYSNGKRLRLALFRFVGHVLDNLNDGGEAVFHLRSRGSENDCEDLEFYFADSASRLAHLGNERYFPQGFTGLAGAFGADAFSRNANGNLELGFRISCPSLLDATTAKKLEKGFGSGRRILLAEDDINSQARMRMQLEKWGYSVRSVSNGSEVLDCLREDGFDLLLLDIQMPEMDGLEAVRRIRAEEVDANSIPIICMSAYRGDVERILDGGANHFLPKPVETSTLKRLLEKVFTGL